MKTGGMRWNRIFRSGMTHMAETEHKKTLNANEICAIIRASYKYQVKKLRVGDLEVEFETLSSRGNAERVFVNQQVVEETPPATHVVHQDETPDFEPDQELLEEMRLAQLMTDNPVAYEQEMIDANLAKEAISDERTDGF